MCNFISNKITISFVIRNTRTKRFITPTNHYFSFAMFHLQTEKQGRVFVCDSSAAVWSVAVRHGAWTRGQHRNFRQRGQEGIPG